MARAAAEIPYEALPAGNVPRGLDECLAELDETRGRLEEASRKAVLADVATTVIHNVGNVLASVNVSAGVVADLVRRSRLEGLAKAAELLRQHEGDLAAFLTSDERGKRLPEYLGKLADVVREERTTILAELDLLQRNVDHIKAVVGMQQAHAKTSGGAVEAVSIVDLVEDALRFNLASYDKHGLQIARDYADLPSVLVDRHKLFQIVMNLLSNARHAVKDTTGQERRISVRLRQAVPGRFLVEVEDTGCGIPAENMGRIFTHGFTTKREGHGFGLASSASAAAEMGGTLTAYSDGEGKGARFTIDLPLRLPAEGGAP